MWGLENMTKRINLWLGEFVKKNEVKGQLISEGLFGIVNSSKKQTKKFNLTTTYDTVNSGFKKVHFSFLKSRVL